MHFALLHVRRSDHRHQQIRRLYDAVASLRCVRDRGLDHAVEREKSLMPLMNLKNLIISEPSKSLPLALISESRDSLRLPFRPIEFIRRHPSVFEEFLPGGIGVQPHIKLTPDAISLHDEENLVYRSVIYKQDVADRLWKLLMVSRVNKIPVRILNWLSWELGLPKDYLDTIVPEFPDCFRLSNERDGDVLELVCWSNELAVSQIEKKFGVKEFGQVLDKEVLEKLAGKILCVSKNKKSGVSKKKKTAEEDGHDDKNVFPFPLKYSTGFEIDSKYKKWLDEWQKLPYISPYENASHLSLTSDESDKWTVGVLHELLNLFVGKKAEREVVFAFGEWLGLRARFKRALLQHPGVFYVSNKIRTHTVVLRDGYSRGMLVARHPLMDMRFKYVQLMNAVAKGDKEAKTVPKKSEPGQEVHNDEELGEVSEVDYEEEEEEEENDNESNGRMDSTRKGASPNISHRDYEDSDGDNEHGGRRDPRNRGVSPNRRFRGRESQRSYADLDGGNEPGRRMKSRNGRASPNKRFHVDGGNEPGTRIESRNGGASPNRRFQERKPRRTKEDVDGEPGRRMMPRNRGGSSPNRMSEGREFQRKSSGGQDKRNSFGGDNTRFNLQT